MARRLSSLLGLGFLGWCSPVPPTHPFCCCTCAGSPGDLSAQVPRPHDAGLGRQLFVCSLAQKGVARCVLLD